MRGAFDSMARTGGSTVGAVAIAGWLGLGLGCGPVVQLADDTGSSEDDGTTTSSTTVPGTTVPGTTVPSTVTTNETFGESPGDEAPDEETGLVFSWEGDFDPPVYECSIFEQDCPEGEKCMPWANDGGSVWNATRCAPVANDPDGVGEPCGVEGSPTSGVDTCDFGAICWFVDPETNEGTCVAFCVGSEVDPYCEDETTHCVMNGDATLALCLPHCDPLLQDCGPGQGCYPGSEFFTCAPDDSGDMGAPGDSCDYINLCDPGTFCAVAELVPDCTSMVGCCTPFCALDDPTPPCLPGQDCVPWFEPGQAPPGYELIGGCVVPM